MGIIMTATVFLFSSLGYCQELSDWERKIFYDTAWKMLQLEYRLSIDPSEKEGEEAQAIMQQFLNQNSVTEEQLKDIIERGNKMPFTAAEKQLAQEMKTEITEDLTPEEIMATLKDLANKYGMSMGQVSSVFTRRILNE